MNPKVDRFLSNTRKWKQEMEQLRQILLDCNLTEELKWGKPCYTYRDKNIVLIHGFKDYCALLFIKGVLLKDTDDILIQQTENAQSARQIRFKNLDDITRQIKILKAYVFEAVEVEKAGLEVELKKTTEYEIPKELQDKLDKDKQFKTAFESLTPEEKEVIIFTFLTLNKPKHAFQELKKAFLIY